MTLYTTFNYNKIYNLTQLEMQQDHRPLTVFYFGFDLDPLDDTIPGSVHFLEHMILDHQTAGEQTPLQMARYEGILLTGLTNQRTMGFRLEGESSNVKGFYHVLEQLIQAILFHQHQHPYWLVNKVRKDVDKEFRTLNRNRIFALPKLYQLVKPNSPYCYDAIGDYSNWEPRTPLQQARGATKIARKLLTLPMLTIFTGNNGDTSPQELFNAMYNLHDARKKKRQVRPGTYGVADWQATTDISAEGKEQYAVLGFPVMNWEKQFNKEVSVQEYLAQAAIVQLLTEEMEKLAKSRMNWWVDHVIDRFSIDIVLGSDDDPNDFVLTCGQARMRLIKNARKESYLKQATNRARAGLARAFCNPIDMVDQGRVAYCLKCHDLWNDVKWLTQRVNITQAAIKRFTDSWDEKQALIIRSKKKRVLHNLLKTVDNKGIPGINFK